MKIPKKTLERKFLKGGYGAIVAVDEVGAGCLAGPLVVCAVLVHRKFYSKSQKHLSGVRDSKLLSSTQREKMVEILKKESHLSSVIVKISPKIIDKINIYRAIRLAMKEATIKLAPKNHKSIILVDGNARIPDIEFEQQTIVKGDRKVFAIACASIIAKVYRDKLMVKYAKKYPEYGFDKHKGYGTKEHYLALKKYGPTPLHRRSFRLV